MDFVESKATRPNELRRTWLFGPGADARAHEAMGGSGADSLIVDLEDFTPPARREEARGMLVSLLRSWKEAGFVTAVRINQLDEDGSIDLAAAMLGRPHVIAYPMAVSAKQMSALDEAITSWERQLGIDLGTTEILPVCETALGVAEVRSIAAGSLRIQAAMLGAEDLVNDLCAERHPGGDELAHARRRFLLDCRAARIEPIDAPYTFGDVDGAFRETVESRRLGYRSKSLVRADHAAAINRALTPDALEVQGAAAIVAAFEAARARGEERALVNGHWVEVPTWRNAQRLLVRARALGVAPPS